MDSDDFFMDEFEYIQRTHGGTFSDIGLNESSLKTLEEVKGKAKKVLKEKPKLNRDEILEIDFIYKDGVTNKQILQTKEDLIEMLRQNKELSKEFSKNS